MESMLQWHLASLEARGNPFCAVALSGLACLVYKRYFVCEVLDADCVFVNTQAQLSQLYYAFAIAITLGRTIVLPEVSALPMMSSCTGCSAAHPIPMVATHSFSTSARCIAAAVLLPERIDGSSRYLRCGGTDKIAALLVPLGPGN